MSEDLSASPKPPKQRRSTIARLAQEHPTIGAFIRAFNNAPPNPKDIGFEPAELAPKLVARRVQTQRYTGLKWAVVLIPVIVLLVVTTYFIYVVIARRL